MKKHKHHLTFGSLALIVGFAAAAPSAMAQTYSVTDLGVLPDKKMSSTAAINNNGQIAGTSFAAGDDESAFVYHYEKEVMEELGIPGSVNRAFAINSDGAAVGDSTFGGAAYGPSPYSHAALFANGNSYDLGSLQAGEFSRANGINSSQQVVGFSGANHDGKASSAFIWSPKTGMRAIGTLGGEFAQAFAINDTGYVTGNSETTETKQGVGPHAFLYRSSNLGGPDMLLDLGTLGGETSYGTSINANNHVAGYSVNANGRVHAFIHRGKAMEDLGSLGGKAPQTDQSFALGINIADQVVGYSYRRMQGAATLTHPEAVAFLYQNGVMQDLNELIGGAAKLYYLQVATAINDRGQITVNAVDYSSGLPHALLLTPVKTSPPQTSIRAAKR